MTTDTAMPASIIKGDTLNFTKSLADYPPGTWTLTYTLVKDGNQVQVGASDNGDGTHLVNALPTTTTDWSAGDYHYQGKVTDGTNTHTVDTGVLTVTPDFADHSTGLDARSDVKKLLDALNATLANKATKDQLSYSIAGRSISRMSLAEVLDARDRIKAEYERLQAEEKLAAGMGTGRKILTRFNN